MSSVGALTAGEFGLLLRYRALPRVELELLESFESLELFVRNELHAERHRETDFWFWTAQRMTPCLDIGGFRGELLRARVSSCCR